MPFLLAFGDAMDKPDKPVLSSKRSFLDSCLLKRQSSRNAAAILDSLLVFPGCFKLFLMFVPRSFLFEWLGAWYRNKITHTPWQISHRGSWEAQIQI